MAFSLSRGAAKGNHSEMRRCSLPSFSNSSKTRKSSQSLKSCTLVTPCARASAMASSSPLRRSSWLGGGMSFATRFCADSRRMPVGWPWSSRSMAPPCGGVVLPVMPAAARAAELAMAMWPSMRRRNAGWPAVILSRSWRVGSTFMDQSVWSQLPPVSQWFCGEFLAKASILVCIAARDLTPVRSTFSLVRPASPRWVWASLKPGKMKLLVSFESTSQRRVLGPASRVTSSLVPTASTLPPPIAMACTTSGLSSAKPTPV